MSLWQDANGNLHDDDNGKALLLPSWPKGLTLLTAAQAAALQPTPTLSQQQTWANSAIDAKAGQVRLKYITAVPGQEATYLQKANDAASYKAAGYPFASLSSYPWVQAEAISINGVIPTAAQVQAAADGIIAMQAAWVTKGAAIEQARRSGKVAVGAAVTSAAVQAAQAAAIAALNVL